MKRTTVRHALGEAERFQEIAKAALQADAYREYNFQEGGPPMAALRRASMDLTRVLAQMRKA